MDCPWKSERPCRSWRNAQVTCEIKFSLSLSLSLSVFQLAEMQRLPIVRPRVHVAGMLPAVMKSSGNVVYYRIIAHPRSNRTGNDSNEGNEERKF